MHGLNSTKVVLAVLPTAAVAAAIEVWHLHVFPLPVPFLLLMTAVVASGALGGRVPGAVAGSIAAGIVLHAYLAGFGPKPMTGYLPQTLAGMATYLAVGFLLGRMRDGREASMVALLDAQRREHEEPLRLAAQIVKLGYYVWDAVADEAIIVSEQHARNYGLSVEAFLAGVSRIGEGYPLVHPDDREKVEAWCRQLRAGSTVEMEYRIPTPAGERWMRAIVRPIIDHNGTVLREVCASLDITEQKETERRLIEAQKLDSIGKLTAGVAHDFNNILMVILANLELVLPETPRPESREMIESALRATRRGAELTRHLLAFGRQSVLNPEVLDANAVIRRMDDLFQRTIPATVQVQTVLAGGVWKIEADRTQLENALLNLAINARDAMPSGGRMTIETANVRIDEEYCLDHGLETGPGRYVLIAVSDTGTGMSRAVLDKVWEPFFTTKDVGAGSGLGLPMVYGFTRQSNGHVQIYSEPGRGTTVKMYFPEAGGRADPDTRLDLAVPDSDPRPRRILVVDDEDDVRITVARQLRRLGHDVAEAGDGNAALALLRSEPAFDLLLTDVVMPGEVQGPALAGIVADEFPAMKVVLMSGYPGGAVENGAATRALPKLIKPVPMAELAATVKSVLGGD